MLTVLVFKDMSARMATFLCPCQRSCHVSVRMPIHISRHRPAYILIESEGSIGKGADPIRSSPRRSPSACPEKLSKIATAQACIHAYRHVHAHAYFLVHVHVYTACPMHMSIHMSTQMSIHMSIHVYVHMPAHMPAHRSIRMHA